MLNSTIDVPDRVNSVKVLSIILGLISIVMAVGGNILVLLSFPLNRQLRSVVSNYFLLSLAVADLIIGVISMPFYVINLIYDQWPFHAMLCDLWLAIDFTSSNSSATHLLLICLDRYLSITRPFTYRIRRTRKKAIFSCVIIWIYSIFIWFVPIFLQRLITEEITIQCYVFFIKNQPYLRILSIMIVFFIPTLLMVILYSGIYIETKNRKKNLNELQAHKKTETDRQAIKSAQTFDIQREFDMKSLTSLKNARLGLRLSTHMSDIKETPPSSPILLFENTMNKSALNSGSGKISSDRFSSNSQGSKKTKTNRRELKNEQKAARTLSAILVAFIMTWAPYSIYTLFYPPPTDLSIIFQLFYTLCYLNSALNPLLYAMCNENFRKTFIILLTCKWKMSQPDANNGCIVNLHTNKIPHRANKRIVFK